MAEEKKVILTKEGYEKLVADLEYLKTVRRNEISEQIAFARGFGDLSENAEYDEAKKEQAKNEAKIADLEATLSNYEIAEKTTTEKVGVGNAVTVLNETLKSEQTFRIVGANEISPRELKISSDSPIGAALLGKKIGDTVSVETPGGIMKLKVLTIAQ